MYLHFFPEKSVSCILVKLIVSHRTILTSHIDNWKCVFNTPYYCCCFSCVSVYVVTIILCLVKNTMSNTNTLSFFSDSPSGFCQTLKTVCFVVKQKTQSLVMALLLQVPLNTQIFSFYMTCQPCHQKWRKGWKCVLRVPSKYKRSFLLLCVMRSHEKMKALHIWTGR